MTAAKSLVLASAVATALSPDILLAAAPHSGVVIHDGFALSDVALFVCAVTGVWFARRSMRARAKARRNSASSFVSSEAKKR